MNCLKRKAESRNQTLIFILHCVAVALFDIGLPREKVLKVMEYTNDLAASIVDDGMNFRDIRRTLKDEYDFEINMT